MNIMYINKKGEYLATSKQIGHGVGLLKADTIYRALTQMLYKPVDMVIMDDKLTGAYQNRDKFIDKLEVMNIPVVDYSERRNSPLVRTLTTKSKCDSPSFNKAKEAFINWKEETEPDQGV